MTGLYRIYIWGKFESNLHWTLFIIALSCPRRVVWTEMRNIPLQTFIFPFLSTEEFIILQFVGKYFSNELWRLFLFFSILYCTWENVAMMKNYNFWIKKEWQFNFLQFSLINLCSQECAILLWPSDSDSEFSYKVPGSNPVSVNYAIQQDTTLHLKKSLHFFKVSPVYTFLKTPQLNFTKYFHQIFIPMGSFGSLLLNEVK